MGRAQAISLTGVTEGAEGLAVRQDLGRGSGLELLKAEVDLVKAEVDYSQGVVAGVGKGQGRLIAEEGSCYYLLRFRTGEERREAQRGRAVFICFLV